MILRLVISGILALFCTASAAAQDVRVRGGSGTAPTLTNGLEAPVFARGLGDIADLAATEDGTVFAADRRSGRIWVLRDRALDGRADTVQALAQRFDAPSSLATRGEALFVSDHSGVWRLQGGGTPQLIAPFGNAGAGEGPHPITVDARGELQLALNMPDGTAQRMTIDTDTGRATRIGTQALRLRAFAKSDGGAPTLWLGESAGGEAFLGGLAEPAALGGPVRAAWVDAQLGRIILASSGGVAVRNVTLLGVDEAVQPLAGGFGAGAVLVDRRGILVAVPGDGTVRVLRPERAGPPEAQTPQAPAPEPALDPELLILRGSGIDRASVYDDIRDAVPEEADSE